jgi:hypothetical protein
LKSKKYPEQFKLKLGTQGKKKNAIKSNKTIKNLIKILYIFFISLIILDINKNDN